MLEIIWRESRQVRGSATSGGITKKVPATIIETDHAAEPEQWKNNILRMVFLSALEPIELFHLHS